MSNTLKPRPLSPHLSIYKPQITSILSIFHRASGVFLSIGIPLIIYWLYALSGGPAAYEVASSFFSNILVKIGLFFWTAAFYYHLCNGIRHLFWDMGKGFDLQHLRTSGIAVLVVAAILTLATWLIA
ncbi:MAG: succinate dehydrogenase, cytochrome b556 subunit [Arenicella sp.]